jgi:hypothetical protein
MRTPLLLSLLLLAVPAAPSFALVPAPHVYFKNLKDGQTVTSPVKVEMGVDGMAVAKAGDIKTGEGHHHLIVDGGPVKQGEVINKDDTHLHYGNGQVEAEVPLSPGPHTLTLQFADGAHRSYGPELSQSVRINVAPNS